MTEAETVLATLDLIEGHCRGELDCFEQTPAANLPTCVEAVEALARFLRSARKLVALPGRPAPTPNYVTAAPDPMEEPVAVRFNDVVEF